MVTVGNVYLICVPESVSYSGDRACVGNDPHAVSDPAFRQKIADWRLFSVFFSEFVQFLYIPVAQKYRTGLGVTGVYMTDPVDLFINSGILMLFDNTGQIIVDRGAGHNSRLGAAVHRLLIQIVTGRTVLHK